jgi:ATP-dependent DNA ligase
MPLNPVPVPMEALLAAELPEGEGWQYEPKWDGFRCIARRDGDRVEMISRSGKPLGRYFPEVLEILGKTKERLFVVDGELILPLADRLDFEALQMRLHPAESRIRKLAKETPAQIMLFDVLAIDARGFDERPLVDRRKALEAFHKANAVDGLLLSPATTERGIALGWLKRSGGALDGVVAKRLDQPYRFGERAMIKVKQLRDRRLRGRWLSLCRKEAGGRFASARSLR